MLQSVWLKWHLFSHYSGGWHSKIKVLASGDEVGDRGDLNWKFSISQTPLSISEIRDR